MTPNLLTVPGKNNDGKFWICESMAPGLSHIVETVTLDDDALSVLGTAEKLGLEWLATGERLRERRVSSCLNARVS